MSLTAVTWIMGATGSVALLFSASAAAVAGGQSPPAKIGIFFTGENSVQVGRALGVRYERYTMPIDPPNNHQIDKIHAAEAAGFRLNIQYNNIVSHEQGKSTSGRVANEAAFETALAADLDATHPELVSIQNEEDGLDFWSGSVEDYLRELTDAVQVAHAKGYKITNGGLTCMGAKLAYWHHLWTTGQGRAADSFARATLNREVTVGRVDVDDFPSSAEPNRPILSHRPLLLSKLTRVEELLAGYRRTGIDYVNFHWYEDSPESMGRVASWLEQVTGLPAISNEMGQYSTSSDTVSGLLAEAESLHMAYVFWFAVDGRGPAKGLAETDGVLRANAAAFKTFLAAHP